MEIAVILTTTVSHSGLAITIYDIGAIIVIALRYTKTILFTSLLAALPVFRGLLALIMMQIRSVPVDLLPELSNSKITSR